MEKESADLHGNAPDTCPVALLIIDMINDLDFPGGDELLQPAVNAADCIAELKARAKSLCIPVIYANDNFGHWRSDIASLVQHSLHTTSRGKPIVERLQPDPTDYVVLKPKKSAFFETTLSLLLQYLGTKRLILTGLSTDVCVQFTAQDAYLRDIGLTIPSNCVASVSSEQTQASLAYMQRVLQADITPSAELDLQCFLSPTEK